MKGTRLFTLLALMCAANISFAQQPLEHKQKPHQEDGKLYWNLDVPFYIFISDNKEGTDKYQLNSEKQQQYAVPCLLDTEGKNYIRTKDLKDPATGKYVYPRQEAMFEVYADGIAPKTSISYGDAKKYNNGSKQFYGKDLKITLKAKDGTSGVNTIYYSVNGAAYKTYSEPFALITENDYSIKYYAVDNVGNVEKTKMRTFSVDTSAPKTAQSLLGKYSESILSARTKIVLEATDANVGVRGRKYKFDSGAYKLVTSSISVASLSQGEHTITYYAYDRLFNEEIAKSFKFYVDKTSPIVTEDILGDQFVVDGKGYSSGRTKLKITAIDNKAGIEGVYYSINNADFVKYEKPFYLPKSSGSVVVKTYAVDKVGNKSQGSAGASSSVRTTYMDLTGPSLASDYAGKIFVIRDTTYISERIKVKLIASDKESGMNNVKYNLDGGAQQTYSEPFNVTKEGFHKIEFTGLDNVNNSNIENVFFYVDNTGPVVYPRFSTQPSGKGKVDKMEVDLYPTHMMLFLSATDMNVGYDRMYYSLNGGSEVPYAGVISGFKRGAKITLKVRALDKLGNESVKEIKFEVEK